MPIIAAHNLAKTYRVFQKKEGLLGAVRGLFRREYKEVHAVAGVSFQIEPGEIVAFLNALTGDIPKVGLELPVLPPSSPRTPRPEL